MRKNEMLGNLDFTSDSDYSYSSEKKNNKKSKKKICKKNTKSKNSKKKSKPKLTKVLPVISPPTLPVIINDEDNATEVLNTIVPKIYNSPSIKRKSEDNVGEKHFKGNNDAESSVFKTNMNENVKLYKNNSNVYAESLKPLSPIIFESSCNSATKSLQYGSKKTSYDNTAPILLDTTVDILPLLNFKPVQKYLNVEQPTLEPILIKPDGKDDCIIEGVFQLFNYSIY